MAINKITVSMVFLAVFACAVSAQDLAAQLEGDDDDSIAGIIFSTPSILLDIESYEGGFGYKVLDDTRANRYSADLFYSYSSNILSIYTLYARENHYTTPVFEKFHISPFTGWYIGSGGVWLRNVTDEDNSTNDWSIPISAGPLVGAELFIFPFLSVTAEYRLSFEVIMDLVVVKSDGDITASTDFDVQVDLKMGNGSRLAVVLYLPEKLSKNRKEKAESESEP